MVSFILIMHYIVLPICTASFKRVPRATLIAVLHVPSCIAVKQRPWKQYRKWRATVENPSHNRLCSLLTTNLRQPQNRGGKNPNDFININMSGFVINYLCVV